MSKSIFDPSACLFEHLSARRFVGLLPLMEWARTVSGWYQWNRPPILASFMIDDPNLHGTSYGFVSFKQLVEEGHRHRFHTSLATVPIDHYYVNRAAAALVRANPDVISLLVHGNNHTYRELAGAQTHSARLAMTLQALARTQSFEEKTGIAVARVMAPPHGACSRPTMATLAQAGFDAVCMSHGAVHASNKSSEWTRTHGAQPTAILEGLPVIPRLKLGRGSVNQALICAFLGQPVVAVGHHSDLRDGVEILAETADSLATLGSVAWSNMTSIARQNLHWKTEGPTLRVRSFSRRFEVTVPEGVDTISIEFMGDQRSVGPLECRDQLTGAALKPLAVDSAGQLFAAVQPGIVEVAAATRWHPENHWPMRIPVPTLALVRRLLTESRDRAMPVLHRLLGSQ